MNDQPRLFDALSEDDEAGFLVSESNSDAAEQLRRWDSWPGGALALTGPAGAGKSLLARRWARQAQAGALAVAVGPLEAQAAFHAFQGRLVLDGADGARDDASFLMLLDLARDQGGALLLVGRAPPGEWPVQIADLRSRLAALPVAEIGEPDEALLAALLQRLCRNRFMKLRDNVARYMAQHMERSFAAAQALAGELDRLMVAGAHPVPYDMAREALRRLEAAGPEAAPLEATTGASEAV